MWQHWINFLLSLVILFIAYTVGRDGIAILAILIVAFSLWGALAGSTSTHPTRQTT